VCFYSPPREFLLQGGVSQTHERKAIRIPRLLRIADKFLIADLQVLIVIYLNDCY
jgi:hypothetical protein